MFPASDNFFDSVSSTAWAVVAVVMLLTATLGLNRRRASKGLWPDLAAWCLVLLSVAWPLHPLLAVALVLGLALALFLIRKQEAASNQRPSSLAPLVALTLLGTFALALHYWYETGPSRTKPDAATTDHEEAGANEAPPTDPALEDEW